MRDYLNIGSSPAGEDCAQVGSENYQSQGRKECRALINQLTRVNGTPPGSASLGVKSFPHDFGSYMEVVCYYEDGDEAALDYALKCEALPEEWDAEAKIELGLEQRRV
jgi:hypothetical protein